MKPQDVMEAAYKGLVHTVLGQGSSAYDSQSDVRCKGLLSDL